ncbi:MAG: hypothetical protein QF435_17140 [Arenicellales bacterium]|nr:hypothetical protein [Arenicellales bacterium]
MSNPATIAMGLNLSITCTIHLRLVGTQMYLHCSQKQLEQAMLADPLGAGV